GEPGLPGNDDFDNIIAVLPVELTDFKGAFLEKEVNLDWSTATEDGNDYFSVERSANGADFVEIGRVTGLNVAASYTFVDQAPVDGVNYYRLRQQDFDGHFAYSEVIQVLASGSSNVAAGVFPNPANTSFNLRLQGAWNDEVTISLLDQTGRVLRTYRQRSTAANELQLPTLVSGMYQVRATDGERVVTTKLLVKQ
ncbi:MAG: T9SS type A sorting domain-containing protein, partial [Bacteroidota bacterium]